MATNDEYTSDKKYPEQNSERSKYPRQWTFKTPGGITVSIGNEKGKEFFLVSHPSGSHTEYHQDGTVTSVVNGEQRTYAKGGGSITFDENFQATITGHCKFSAGGGAVLEIKGDLGIVVAGSINMGAMENLAMSGKNVYIGATGNMNMEAKGDLKVSARGTGKLESAGQLDLGSSSGIKQNAPRIDLNDGGGGYEGGAATVPTS